MLNAGMDEGWYNGLMIATTTIATLGTIASSVGYSFKNKSIQQIGKIDKSYGMRFTTANDKMRVVSFHTHAHETGPKGIWGWHWTLKKFDQ